MKQNTLALTLLMMLSALLFLSFEKDELVFSKNGIRVYKLEAHTGNQDAKLELKNPPDGEVLDAGMDTFSFAVKHFSLGLQTIDSASNSLPITALGQHIHLNIDNRESYQSNSAAVVAGMKPGHHVLFGFLARSTRESIKAPGAYVLKQFDVAFTDTVTSTKLHLKDFGNLFPREAVIDEASPQLFYNMPDGNYPLSARTKNVPLDFYLVNCKLSPAGYKVRVTLGSDEFVFTEWAPYYIEGLPEGKTKVKLELLDKDNAVVKSPCLPAERIIQVMKPLR